MLAKKLGTKLGFEITVYFSFCASVCSLDDGEHWMSVVTLELLYAVREEFKRIVPTFKMYECKYNCFEHLTWIFVIEVVCTLHVFTLFI